MEKTDNKRKTGAEEKTASQAVTGKEHVPMSFFLSMFGILLLIGGVHAGLLIGMKRIEVPDILLVHVVLLYWVAASFLFASYIWRLIRKYYEKPMRELARAAKEVAHGDFSVYMPAIHTPDKQDYLDELILDFDRMVEELESIETLKTDFFSNVSHEIKTPLAVILANSEMLAQTPLDASQREYVETTIRSGRKLSELISNILRLNKLEKQKIEPAYERYDLCEQLCDCILQFENRFDEKNLELDTDMEDRRNIEADRSLLDLVWTNLLSNAVKFTENGGKIFLKEYTSGNAIIVSVKDTGCGMAKETVTHIFDKFYQGDTSHATEGNGLGLALTARILQLMHADITVTSSPGEGTEFIVRLPLRSAAGSTL